MDRGPKYRAGVIAIVICMIAPLVVCAIAAASLPDIVPLRFDAHGDAIRWETRWELLTIGALMAGLEAFLLLLYVKADSLRRWGLTRVPHTPKRDEVVSARAIIVACAAICTVIFACCIFAAVATTLKAL